MSIDTSGPRDHTTQASPNVEQPTTSPTGPPSIATKKRKRKDKDTAQKPHVLYQCTFRKTQWTYFHLTLITPGLLTTTSIPLDHNTSTPSVDPLTTALLLRSALQSYLGLTGSAITIDILKTSGRNVWVRIQRQDARGFRAALSGWQGVCDGEKIPSVGEGEGRVKVAWRVVGEEGSLLGVQEGGDGRGAFGD